MRTVVGAVIVRDDLVMAARRKRPAEMAGLWEFPGGKVEEREKPRPALAREIWEELGVAIHVGTEVRDQGNPWLISDEYVLRLFLASLLNGEPHPKADHDAILWLNSSRLHELNWLPADERALPAIGEALLAPSDQ